jgi:hypothetical protein
VLGPLGCVRDVLCVPECCVVSRAPVCHACFPGDFDCFSVAFAPWLRRGGRVADGSVVYVCVFGLGFWRDIVGLCLVVLGRVLGRGVFDPRIWGWFGGFLGRNSIFGVCSAECASVLVVVLG